MSQPINRRELLKILAAATGATILSSVPNKRVTPIVDIGTLPAHAQGSQRGSIQVTVTEKKWWRQSHPNQKGKSTENNIH